MAELPHSSMQSRLNRAGIETIREAGKVFLEYQGKRIARPIVNTCEFEVKKEFGVEI